MITYTKQQIKEVPLLSELLLLIKRTHQLPEFLIQQLEANGPNKPVATRYYAEYGRRDCDDHNLFVHYDAATWIKDDGQVAVSVEELGIYDDAKEYHQARIADIKETLAQGKPSEELIENEYKKETRT